VPGYAVPGGKYNQAPDFLSQCPAGHAERLFHIQLPVRSIEIQFENELIASESDILS
jgi:hypothetical protein